MRIWLWLGVLLMAAPLRTYAGSFNVTTAAIGNTVVVTGLGFQPQVLLFFWSGRTESTDASGRLTHTRGFGVALSTTSRWAVTSRSLDAAGLAQTSGYHTNAACIAVVSSGETEAGAMDLQSLNANGFTLVIDNDFPADIRVSFVAIAGANLVAVAGSLTPAGVAPVTQTVSGLSITPTAVLFGAVSSAAGAAPAGVVDSHLMIGAMTGASGEGVWTGGSDDTPTTMQTMHYCRSGECIARFNAGVTAIEDRAEFSAFASGEFTINWLERTSAGTIFYLALGGVDASVGDLLTQTDLTTAIVESGFGFSPASVLIVSAGIAETAADTPGNHDLLSIGAVASNGLTSQTAHTVYDPDGIGTSTVFTAARFGEVYCNVNASSVLALMRVTSLAADGFNAIMDDADATQMFAWYLALGPRTPEAKVIQLNQAVNRASTF